MQRQRRCGQQPGNQCDRASFTPDAYGIGERWRRRYSTKGARQWAGVLVRTCGTSAVPPATTGRKNKKGQPALLTKPLRAGALPVPGPSPPPPPTPHPLPARPPPARPRPYRPVHACNPVANHRNLLREETIRATIRDVSAIRQGAGVWGAGVWGRWPERVVHKLDIYILQPIRYAHVHAPYL